MFSWSVNFWRSSFLSKLSALFSLFKSSSCFNGTLFEARLLLAFVSSIEIWLTLNSLSLSYCSAAFNSSTTIRRSPLIFSESASALDTLSSRIRFLSIYKLFYPSLLAPSKLAPFCSSNPFSSKAFVAFSACSLSLIYSISSWKDFWVLYKVFAACCFSSLSIVFSARTSLTLWDSFWTASVSCWNFNLSSSVCRPPCPPSRLYYLYISSP